MTGFPWYYHIHDAVCHECDGTGRSGARDVDESRDDQTVWVEAQDPFLAHAINARLIALAVSWTPPERVHLAGGRVVIRDLRACRVAIVAA